jgi:hypothetical protein
MLPAADGGGCTVVELEAAGLSQQFAELEAAAAAADSEAGARGGEAAGEGAFHAVWQGNKSLVDTAWKTN